MDKLMDEQPESNQSGIAIRIVREYTIERPVFTCLVDDFPISRAVEREGLKRKPWFNHLAEFNRLNAMGKE